VNRRATIDNALAGGFAFVQMGRALLREPELLLEMEKDAARESLCIHCNKCMPTIYSRTRCVIAPDETP
jgi:2,4-dienoyl-CoA reductase-like NADH-dependent reductase (Old Yellow Enzyme family)